MVILLAIAPLIYLTLAIAFLCLLVAILYGIIGN